MMEICLLGTGGMMPLVNRYLTSLYVKSNGSSLLIDCGEATQVAIKKAKLSVNPIDYILITHFHADHISGIAGLLLSMGNSDRKKDVVIVGPEGIEKVVKSLRIIAPDLPFNLKFIELKEDFNSIFLPPFNIDAFQLNHRLSCFGYNIVLKRLPMFIKEKALDLNIPIKYWNKLQHGEEVYDKENNKTYLPSMVVGEERKGIKVSYFTDTRPCDNIYKYATKSDLIICEGMYGDDTKIDNAKLYKHMTMIEAANIANKLKPQECWLTHYSPSENNPIIYQDNLQQIFKDIFIVKDGKKKVINFE